MSGRDAGLALALLLQAVRAGAQTGLENGFVVNVRGADGVTIRTAQGAVALASRWLAEERCQEVFSDFSDRAGKKLSENLRTAGQTGLEYLRWLILWDGAHEPACAWRDAFAATRAGSRVVHLCPVFKKLQSDLPHAAVILIHEELHSLGLGENPPSSLEITARVIEKCQKPAEAARLR